MKQRWRMVVLIALLAVLVAACTSFRGGQRPITGNERYFTGTQGVIARFENFPTRIYYYPGGTIEDNTFEVGVDVRNEGASFTRGGIYISGYDPNLIRVRGVEIAGGGLGSCGLNILSGGGAWGLLFGCEGVQVGADTSGNWVANIEHISDIFGWDKDKIDLALRTSGSSSGSNINLDLNNPNLDWEYLGFGRFFLSYFSGISFTRTFGQEYNLYGDMPDTPGGEIDFKRFEGTIQGTQWPPGLDELKQNLVMTNCYFYTTHASPLVCIDPDPMSENVKVCRPGQHTWTNSQGAPVAITAIEQEMSKRKAIFRITIQNVGTGEIFDPGKLEKCSPYLADRVRAEDKNIVYVGDIRIGNTRLTECTPDNAIRLINGRGTITCSYPLGLATGLKTGYETPLVVELWYGYRETQMQQILIKRMV